MREMDRLGLILDVTHLCDETFWDALDIYEGPVRASHHNCRALVDDPRQLSDEQIQALAQRDAVIGLALDTWMVVPGWIRGTSTPESTGATLEKAAEHLDHICQLLGTARHVGIGTDLDGGFGNEQSPVEVDSIADVPQILDILRSKGYSEPEVEGIAHRNFIDLLRKVLP